MVISLVLVATTMGIDVAWCQTKQFFRQNSNSGFTLTRGVFYHNRITVLPEHWYIIEIYVIEGTINSTEYWISWRIVVLILVVTWYIISNRFSELGLMKLNARCVSKSLTGSETNSTTPKAKFNTETIVITQCPELTGGKQKSILHCMIMCRLWFGLQINLDVSNIRLMIL